MMKTTSPIHSDVGFASIETSSPLHAASGADTAEFEESVKDRTIVTDIVLGLLFDIRIHVVWSDFVQEVDILIGMELTHFVLGGWLGTL